MKEIKDYVIGEQVQIATTNPRQDPTGKNDNIWHDGVVTDITTIHPGAGEHHQPYTMVIVRFTRTYCTATPQYLPVSDETIDMLGQESADFFRYVDSVLTFYDKESHEGFFYKSQIRPKP